MRWAADTPTRAADGADSRAAELVRAAVLADLARRVVADCGADVGLVGVPDPGPRAGRTGAPVGGTAGRPAGLVLRHWAGTRAALLHDLAVPSGSGLGGKALAERVPSWVSDYRAATTISHDHDAVVGAEGLFAMLTVPLLLDGAVLGVVYASLRTVVPFGDVRIGAVTELTAVAGRALARAAAWTARTTLGTESREAADLTPREGEVLRWAAIGRTDPEIAAQLGLTRDTVTGCLKGVMHKLGVRNRVELAPAARECGLIG